MNRQRFNFQHKFKWVLICLAFVLIFIEILAVSVWAANRPELKADEILQLIQQRFPPYRNKSLKTPDIRPKGHWICSTSDLEAIYYALKQPGISSEIKADIIHALDQTLPPWYPIANPYELEGDPDPHFSIHYTTDAQQYPNDAVELVFVKHIAENMEDCWDALVENPYSFREPYTKSGKTDVIIYHSDGSWTAPDVNWIALEIDDLRGDYEVPAVTVDPLKGLAIPLHEIFHRVQYSYDPGEEKWLKEGTARWMEDAMDTANSEKFTHPANLDHDYNGYVYHVNKLLSSPDTTLTNNEEPSAWPAYAAVLYWKYFSEQYSSLDDEPQVGVDIIRALWEAASLILKDGVGAVNEVLSQDEWGSTTFEESFKNWIVANFAKNLDDIGSKYDYLEKAIYGPLIFEPNKDISLVPGDSHSWDNEEVNSWAADYFKINLDSPVDNVLVDFNGEITGISPFDDFIEVQILVIKDNALYISPISVELDIYNNFPYPFSVTAEYAKSIVIIVGGADDGGKYDITVEGGLETSPTADFSGSPRSGVKPLTVQFTNESTGNITSWFWDFGDGEGTSTLRNPSYIYTEPGTYTVSLKVIGPGGEDTETKADYIEVTESAPVAGFSGSPRSGLQPLTVQFTDESTGNITSWFWDFGDDEGTSTLRNPLYIYTEPGTYTVSLTVTGPGGEDMETKINYINVGENPESGRDVAVRFFHLSSSSVPPGGNITLYATFENHGDQYEDIVGHWYLYDPSGNQFQHVNRIYPNVPDTNGSTGEQSETFPTGSSEGYWTAVVWAELSVDDHPEDNQSSLPFYVGTAQEYTQYKLVGDTLFEKDKTYWDWSGQYGIKPTYFGKTYATVDIIKKNVGTIEPDVRFYEEDVIAERAIKKFDGNRYFVYCNMFSELTSIHVLHGIPGSTPFTYEPIEPRGTQGSSIFWSVTPPYGKVDDALPSDIIGNKTVQSWYYDYKRLGNSITREFRIPLDAPIGKQTFYIRDMLVGEDFQYIKLTDMYIDPAHDISVSNLEPSDGSSFKLGDTIVVSATISAAGGHTEHPNVTLSITGPDEYAYEDSQLPEIKDPQTVTFEWDTTGLSSGEYTITVTAFISGDSDESNNSQSSKIELIRTEPWTIHVSTTGDDTTGDGTAGNPYRTIQKGIDTAIDGDTVLVADGMYTGAGNVNLDFSGKAITVKSKNGADNCIIDCENTARGFYFHSGETPDSILDGFTIRNGSAQVGGGIYCDYSSPTITNNIITQNKAPTSNGGGIWCSNNSSPMIINNTITANLAFLGGGIDCFDNSSPVIINNTITANSAWFGSGINCWYNCSPVIINNTITANSPAVEPFSDGGGIYCNHNSSPIIINTILWNNTKHEIYFRADGKPNTVTISYSDVQGGEAGIITRDNGTVYWLEGNINADPMFLDPDNGDYHLSDSSPCIGAGTSDATPPPPPTDLEGNPRPAPDGSNPDIGAYENSRPAPLIEVIFPDQNLEAAIREALNKPEGPITSEDLAGLTVLNAPGRDISDLTGIEHCINLRELHLWGGNKVSDITSLSNLTNLHILTLDNNQISDIRPLINLTNLQILHLGGNHQITDISPLSGLTNLRNLEMGGNEISNISPLSNLTDLRLLYLDHNLIINISPLEALTKIGEWEGGVQERDGVNVHLGISNNQISDISYLVNNPGLGEGDGIDLRGNPLNDEAYDSHIPALQEIGVNLLFDVNFPPGDVSMNGILSAYDASLILQHIVNLIQLSDEQIQIGDVSDNGTLTAYDAALILQKIVGLIDTFTAEGGTPLSPLIISKRRFVWLEDVKVKDGEVIRIPILINDADGVIAGGFTVRFDPEAMRFIGTEEGNLTSESYLGHKCEGGNLQISLASPEEMSGGGRLLMLNFESEGKRWVDEVKIQIEKASLNERMKVDLRGGVVRFIPLKSELLANYPNPFNPETWIPFGLAEDADVVIRIYDISGRLVRMLDLGYKEAGSYTSQSRTAHWDGRNELRERVASGVYIYHLKAGEFTATRRMLIIK